MEYRARPAHATHDHRALGHLLRPATVDAHDPQAATDRLDHAVTQLQRHNPAHSAMSGLWPAQRLWLALIASASVFLVAAGPTAATLAIQILFATAFALVLAVRLLAINHVLRHPAKWHPPAGGQHDPPPRASNDELPVYTILIALHAEVPVVPQLVAALMALDYPPDKLDIIFALEAHDHETYAALTQTGLPGHMRLIVVPPGSPRTKPRALCYGLTFARGTYVVVYDAEDVPNPGQLRAAYAAFASSPSDLGCLQASLAINSARRSWLASQFAVEYTVLFDAILPALAAHNLPIPLGGTSNHFPRTVLESVGGWDPYNVTEDADLGLRLARSGWRVDVLPSTTWEEAPPHASAWFNQRTRWQKGWLQTYFVHMRNPGLLRRELGWKSWLWFQIVLGGGLLTALAHPWFYAILMLDWVNGRLFPALNQGSAAWLWWIGIANFAAASIATITLAVITLQRRNRSNLLAHALMAPLYWLPISVAGYRAAWQWYRAPFYWANPPHTGTPTAITT